MNVHHHAEVLGWRLDPLLTVPLAVSLLILLVGWRRLSRRASTRVRPSLFLGGWAVLALSLTSPLHEAGERSFTMHMIEHELIMLVATLLLASSSAGAVLAWGLPRPLRRSLGGDWNKIVLGAVLAFVLIFWPAGLVGLFRKFARSKA